MLHSRRMKAQSISMNTVIIAALGLLVLIVIALIFSGKIRVFGTESRKCSNQGGGCESLCESNEVEVPNTECVAKCCLDSYTDSNIDNEW